MGRALEYCDECFAFREGPEAMADVLDRVRKRVRHVRDEYGEREHESGGWATRYQQDVCALLEVLAARLQEPAQQGGGDGWVRQCNDCGESMTVYPSDPPTCGACDSRNVENHRTAQQEPEGGEGERVYPRLTCTECHTTSGGDELDCALCPNCGGHTFTVEPGDHE